MISSHESLAGTLQKNKGIVLYISSTQDAVKHGQKSYQAWKNHMKTIRIGDDRKSVQTAAFTEISRSLT